MKKSSESQLLQTGTSSCWRTGHIIETFSGTPREMGREWGRTYRHLIQALFWECMPFHHPHPIEKRLDELAEKAIDKFRRWTPDYLAEMEAAAPECGLTLEQMALRADGFVYQRKNMYQKAEGCFQIGVNMPGIGPIVGSIMDSARVVFAWWRLRPAKGYAHLALTIPGTACSDRGMNEHGLVVSESSTPTPGVDFWDDLLLHTLGTRLVLEQCRTVKEAVALMTSLPVSHAYIFADAEGGLLGLQTSPVGHKVYELENGAVVLANHIRDGELLRKHIQHGYDPLFRNAGSELRVKIALELVEAHKGNRDFDFIRSVLSSHLGHPDSICRDGNAASFIAMPQADAKHIWIAERFPCASPFLKYSVV